MKKRPLSIVIITIVYFLEPVGNLIQAAFINNLPFFGEYGILSRLLWTDWVMLGLFPVVAVSIYKVRKWGWYLFICFSVLLISYNLIVYYCLNPNYSFETVLLFILIITGISAFFFRKHVYAPYFNPRLRWWETAARYRVTLDTTILTSDGAKECNILDISETGCFVNDREELDEGSHVWLRINCKEVEINCFGKVVRKSGPKEQYTGHGIMFQNMPKETKKKIRHLVWSLERLDYEDRKDVISTSEIPKDFHDRNYNFLNQMGFRIRSSLKHAFNFA